MVLIDGDGNLWFATRQGLRRTRGTDGGSLESFAVDNGLSGEIVNTILEDREGNFSDRHRRRHGSGFRHTNISRLPPSVGALPA